MMKTVLDIVLESWLVLGDMAPYLLFGFFVAGVLSVGISPRFVERHLGSRGFGPVFKASLMGIPLPLCSCGVIPVAAGFRRHGASRAATTSFLLSTPQTGVDSIAITYALLGFWFAAFRPIAALATGLLGGFLVMLFGQPPENNIAQQAESSNCTKSCCTNRGAKHVVWRALEYGFVTLPRDIGAALLVGVVIAGAIAALAPPNEWRPYLGGGIFSMLLTMALGIPIYVCASASVPIAAGLMHLGASPGAALAFLVSGPASNAATVATIWKLLGPRSMMLYMLTIAIGAVGGGLTLDWLLSSMQFSVPPLVEHSHEAAAGGWSSGLWAIGLLAVLTFSYFAKPKPEAEGNELGNLPRSNDSGVQQIELAVHGMTCDHCSEAVRRAFSAVPGVASVVVDRASGRAVVIGSELKIEQLVQAVELAGYRATVENRSL